MKDEQLNLEYVEDDISKCPNFYELLKNPLIKLKLPSDFDENEESEHLGSLWKEHEGLRKYKYLGFVHAGGSGMVFKALLNTSPIPHALKIARKKLFKNVDSKSSVPKNLSPVPQRELSALQKLQHPNVVQLYEAIEAKFGIIALSTTYIENPYPIDHYLYETLQKAPSQTQLAEGFNIMSPERLDNTCKFVLDKCLDLAYALKYMHDLDMYHFDIKPANILIPSTSKDYKVHLTDLGACVDTEEVKKSKSIRVQFTWTYAHPELTDLVSNPASITGGGLKATADVNISKNLAAFDLFAFGRTIQELLGIIEYNFGERCFTSYAFKYLHIVSSLLLDGKVSVLNDKVDTRDGKRFIRDVAMEYPDAFFKKTKIESASELVDILERFEKKFSWNEQIPELDIWQSRTINTGLSISTPFTKRVEKVMSHPSIRRLKSEHQLGWMKEIYPGATHSRWSHTVGVFSATVNFYNSLLADPDIPTFKIVVKKSDIEHGLLAALLHDIGQSAFAHDFEAASPDLYDHEKMVERLLDDKSWGQPTLRDTIKKYWKDINLKRVINILNRYKSSKESEYKREEIDGISSDIIDSPIDSDKLDYLVRDSVACNVPYGKGIDWQRFLSALTVDVKKLSATKTRLALAYKGKGSPAIESLLLCRYQMYGAVYWHHSYRCIQAMFIYSVVSTFITSPPDKVKIGGNNYKLHAINELLFQRIICNNSVDKCLTILAKKRLTVPDSFKDEAPNYIAEDKSIEFIWKLAESPIRELLERLSLRKLYKRVFEIKYGELDRAVEFTTLKNELLPSKRVLISKKLQENILNAIYKRMTGRSETIESIAENFAKERFDSIKNLNLPLIIIDFPSRGIPNEKNFPTEISDSSRKYIAGNTILAANKRGVFGTIRNLQMDIAALRIFSAPELHELIVRYLNPEDIYNCITAVLPSLEIQ